MYTVKIIYVEPATKNFVAFTNGARYTVSAWNIHFLFIAVPSQCSAFYVMHICSSFAQFWPIWSLCSWIMSGRPIKNWEVTCYLWHHEYSCYLGIGISYIFLYFLLFGYYFLSFSSIVSSKFCCWRKCKCSCDSNANVSAAIVMFSIVSSLLCNCRHEIFKWK